MQFNTPPQTTTSKITIELAEHLPNTIESEVEQLQRYHICLRYIGVPTFSPPSVFI